MTEHCLAWTRSQCPDKVDDIQAVRKSSIYQCNSSGPLLFSVDQWKIPVFHTLIPSLFSRIWISNGTAVLVKCQRKRWSFLEWKTGIFFIDSQKNKSEPELLFVTEKWKRLHAVIESRMEARFSTFSTNRCDWISISCSKTCWTYWLFCTVRTPNIFVYFTVTTKANKVIISRAVQLWLFFKTVISFCLNSILLSHITSLQSWGRFLWSTRYS